MSTSQQWPSSKIRPAQLSFLAIYNPSLGPTDDTFPDQVVYYYSRIATEARKKKDRRSDKAAREEENEELRQIGLAQGMVGFARTFSDGEPVDSVETEKSRVVLYELEKGWWILASIDLTRLPIHSASASAAARRTSTTGEKQPSVEYSSREVSPPALLVQQILQAHYIFLLHHGRSLSDVYVRLPRDKFCRSLDRFWTRFSRSWDVLLHGNPAVDTFSGLKLSAGGELGVGVGEEDWGSSERDVLEELTHRTEGLVDLVVSRFGDSADAQKSSTDGTEALPWMGSGAQAVSSDGIIFSGISGIARSSLRNVSLWMQQVYTHGDHAYGVRDNPHRERLKRRRHNSPPGDISKGSVEHTAKTSRVPSVDDLRQEMVQQQIDAKQGESLASPPKQPKDDRPQMHDRVASHDHATDHPQPQIANHPGIPPRRVSAAEHALNRASLKANGGARSRRDAEVRLESEVQGTTMGIPDVYMKYMTFGLSTLIKPATKPAIPKRPKGPRRTSTSSSMTLRPTDSYNSSITLKPPLNDDIAEGDEDADTVSMALDQVDPMPDGEGLSHRIAMQKRQENKGHFVIGLKGDLDEVPAAAEVDADMTDGSFYDDTGGSRTLLRTVQVEVIPKPSEDFASDADDTHDGKARKKSIASSLPAQDEALRDFKRVQVLIYARRPFIYCFLFEQRTPALSLPRFYKQLHQNLAPIHKPLLNSTNVAKIAERIQASHEPDTAASGNAATEKAPIYDLVYDPRSLSVHTSIPSIPDPGTPAAEGLAMAPWTRIEAINVHSQILSTLASTQRSKGELERTSKTARGWWVVWMRVPPSRDSRDASTKTADNRASTDSDTPTISAIAPSTSTISKGAHLNPFDPDNPHLSNPLEQFRKKEDMSRIAFLVRKSTDAAASKTTAASTSNAVSGMFGFSSGSEDKTALTVGSGWGPPALGGNGLGGIGVDARRYVEGLLSLNR